MSEISELSFVTMGCARNEARSKGEISPLAKWSAAYFRNLFRMACEKSLLDKSEGWALVSPNSLISPSCEASSDNIDAAGDQRSALPIYWGD